MSVIYDALKKAENKDKKELNVKKKKNSLILILWLIPIILFFISGIQYFKKRVVVAPKNLEEKETKITPPAENLTVTPTYILEGIIYDEDSPIAIINGQILKKQDKIGDFEVININLDSVELFNSKENSTLKLPLKNP